MRIPGNFGAGSWRLAVTVPTSLAGPCQTLLEPFGGVLTAFEDAGGASWTLALHLEAAPELGPLKAALAMVAGLWDLPPPQPTLTHIPATDWVDATRRNFPPIRVGRFHISGSHVTGPGPSGTLPVLIDAGPAFGTGEHPTTAGCLLALADLARRSRPRRVLDMGCGSGILAIALVRLVPSCSVLAADVDPWSVARTRAHMRLNRLSGYRLRAVVSDGYRSRAVQSGVPYDWIVANILARPLARMALHLSRALAPGGYAVLAGLLTGQAASVIAAHRRQGLVVVGKLTRGAWTILILRRPQSALYPLPGGVSPSSARNAASVRRGRSSAKAYRPG